MYLIKQSNDNNNDNKKHSTISRSELHFFQPYKLYKTFEICIIKVLLSYNTWQVLFLIYQYNLI